MMARGGMGCLAGLVHFLVNDFFWFWGGGWIDEGRIRGGGSLLDSNLGRRGDRIGSGQSRFRYLMEEDFFFSFSFHWFWSEVFRIPC